MTLKFRKYRVYQQHGKYTHKRFKTDSDVTKKFNIDATDLNIPCSAQKHFVGPFEHSNLISKERP